MENNNWVDHRLAALNQDWQPDVQRALGQLGQRQAAEARKRRGWTWAAAVTVTAGLCIAIFPTPRAAAQRICETCGGFIARQVAYTGHDRKAAPNFTLTDASGRRVRLSDYKGKVVLLDFWATWCHGCKTEIPWFMEFQDRYKRSGLEVIGVSMDGEGWKAVKPFIEQHPFNYAIVVGDDALAKRYGLDSMPMTLLIDRTGKIAAAHVGMVDKGSFEKELQALLDQRKS